MVPDTKQIQLKINFIDGETYLKACGNLFKNYKSC